MSAATPTGAELRARREALGLSVEWIEGVLDITRVGHWRAGDGAKAAATGTLRRRVCEGLTEYYPYSVSEVAEYCAAYAAALDAEEARRASAEPVPPEGVTPRDGATPGIRIVRMIDVHADGGVYICGGAHSVAELRYAADLAEYRAAQHAAGDRQRKLDAVEAAEEAHADARRATDDACKAEQRTYDALTAARKEAGL